MSPNAISLLYAVGAMVLGAWLFFRPVVRAAHDQGGLPPRRGRVCVLFVTGPATAATETLAGPTVALLCAYLPILTLVFWSALHLLRVTIATVGRSAG